MTADPRDAPEQPDDDDFAASMEISGRTSRKVIADARRAAGAPQPDPPAPTREDGRAWRDFDHRWHVAINRRSLREDGSLDFDKAAEGHFMYEAKKAADEVPRLAYWFRLEREGRMPALHQQCSHSQPEPIADNHLTCCLGVECRACPFLAAIDAGQLSGPEKDLAKAWTCAAHIISKGGDPANEGYVLTTSDRMYWDNLYLSLSGADMEGPDDE